MIDSQWNPGGKAIIYSRMDKEIVVFPVGIEGLLALADSLILRDPPEFTPEEHCLYLHECGE